MEICKPCPPTFLLPISPAGHVISTTPVVPRIEGSLWMCESIQPSNPRRCELGALGVDGHQESRLGLRRIDRFACDEEAVSRICCKTWSRSFALKGDRNER
jgi:hypothetical protein